MGGRWCAMHTLFRPWHLFLVEAEAPDKGIHVVAYCWIKVIVWYEHRKLLRVVQTGARAALAGKAQGFGSFLRHCNILRLVQASQFFPILRESVEAVQELTLEADRGLQLASTLRMPTLLELPEQRTGRQVVPFLAGLKKAPEFLSTVRTTKSTLADIF